jgi:hypothetical protein
MLGININSGYSGLDNVMNGSITDAASSISSLSSDGGGGIGGAAGGVVSGIISPYASLLNIVGLGGAFQSTFGSVLANGFDISCWGSSKAPSTIKGVLTTNYQPYFQNLLSDVQNGDLVSINRFIKDVYIVNHAAIKMQTATSWSSCSRKGLKLYLDFMNPLQAKADELISQFVSNGAKKTTMRVSSNFKMGSFTVEGGENLTISVPMLSAPVIPPVVVPMEVTVPKTPLDMSSLTPNRTLDTIDGGELQNVTVQGGGKSKSSFPWWIVALGLGAI